MDFFQWLKSLDFGLAIYDHAYSDSGISVVITGNPQKGAVLIPLRKDGNGPWTTPDGHGKNLSHALQDVVKKLLKYKRVCLTANLTETIPVPPDLKIFFGTNFYARLEMPSFDIEKTIAELKGGK